MQGKYKIYISYLIIMIVGVLLFIFFIFFLESATEDKYEDSTVHAQTEVNQNTNLNDEFRESINAIDENASNIEIVDSEIQDIKNANEIYKINVNVLNIREEPNVESNIINQLLKDEEIEIKNINNNWGEVVGGGYVYMGLLSKNDGLDNSIYSEIKTYIVVTNVLNIREEPNVESNIINQLLKDEEIEIKNINNNWGEVVGGGYVYMGLLKENN